MKNFDIVVAVDLNRGIGKAGQLPWKLSGDLKHFKDITSKVSTAGRTNAVIMGRKTWESIPDKRRPLTGRVNVVLTGSGNLALPEGVVRAATLDEALRALQNEPVESCFVIGGGRVYADAIEHDLCNLLYLTEIKNSFECDTFFPDYAGKFSLISRSDPLMENGIEYSFKVFRKGDS